MNYPFESTFESNSSRLSAVWSVCRSSLHPSYPKTSGQSAASGHQWMSCISRGPVQRWQRLSGPPGATWSKRSHSKAEGATNWTLAGGGTCWEKTPCKVRLDLQPPSRQQRPPRDRSAFRIMFPFSLLGTRSQFSPGPAAA